IMFVILYYPQLHTLYPCTLHAFPPRRSSDLNPAIGINILSSSVIRRYEFQVQRTLGLSPLPHEVTETTPTSLMTSKNFSLNIVRSEEHTSELQSRFDLVCRLLLEKKNTKTQK